MFFGVRGKWKTFELHTEPETKSQEPPGFLFTEHSIWNQLNGNFYIYVWYEFN